MRAFNPTAPARHVIEAGLVCEELHQSLYRNLAARADLEPGSQQLLVGEIGSGKTTELMLAERLLSGQGHVLPLYIDVTGETDLSTLNAGALLACFGLRLSELAINDWLAGPQDEQRIEGLVGFQSKIDEFAHGKRIKYRPGFRFNTAAFKANSRSKDDTPTKEIPGRPNPPVPPLDREISEVSTALEGLLATFKEAGKEVVAIFDGLDRLLDATKFWSIVHQDLRLLRELKVSVLATAPLSVLFGGGVGQSISDRFDRVQHLSVIAADPGNTSLRSVLDKRHGSELLAVEEADAICQFSGGVLRDLISLARDAAEEAYVSDHDSITAADVEKVVHQLGTGDLRGLGPDAISTLLKLEGSKSFNVNEPANVELLLTRRVLEYSSTDFRVHPGLLSVIPRSEPKRA